MSKGAKAPVIKAPAQNARCELKGPVATMRHSEFEIDKSLRVSQTPDGPASARKSVANRTTRPQHGDDDAARTQDGLRKLLGKQMLPLVLTLAIGLIVWNRAQALDFAAISASIAATRPDQWVLALIATLGSFWAVGQYDRVLHAQLGTGISSRSARLSGMSAIGLSQFLGFGALTGTLIRWRMLPELTLWQAARLSAAVALSFLAGWAVVAACAVLIFQPDIAWMKTLATGAVALCAMMGAMSVYPPAPLARLPWPSLRTMGTVVGLAALDTVLAGIALYILLPPELALALGQTVSAYLFSLGAGIVGSTPGGVGPFEATMVALLPQVPLEPLLGAVIAFRVVYYLIPAAVAALMIAIGPRASNLSKEPKLEKTIASPYLDPATEVQLFAAPRAEAGLLRTRDFSLLKSAQGRALGIAAPVGQSLVMLSDPLPARACPSETREALSLAAARRYRMPAMYKCGARMAASARRAGWRVLPTAEEAWLKPADFSLEGSKLRQLRRVLRKAEEAEIVVRDGQRDLPLDDMDRIAAEWSRARGGERGFSMGTYDRDYINCQRVFLAYRGGDLVAFISLHESRAEMTLDLMRSGAQAPDGTIQLLIVAAIRAAAKQGCPRLSLAAVPFTGDDRSALLRRLRQRVGQKSGAAGLRRFKAAFNPRWETLYMAAPSRLSLAVAAMDVLRRITAPPRHWSSNPMRAAKFATHRSLRLFRGLSR